MCKSSLCPAVASAQCHIQHPLRLTLSTLPPLESAPACRPRPPADEDLEREDGLLTLSSQATDVSSKSSYKKDKLSIDNLCKWLEITLFTKVQMLGHAYHSLKQIRCESNRSTRFKIMPFIIYF